jgi:hypothetical protein
VVLPFFPNVARRHNDVLDRLEEALTGVAERQGELERRYETLEKFVRESKAQSATSLPQATNGDRKYKYGLSLQEWQSMPPPVKATIAALVASRLVGRYWLAVCVVVCISALLLVVFGVTKPIVQLGPTLCMSMLMISLGALYWTRLHPVDRSWTRGPWDNLDTVIFMRNQGPPIWFFGFEIAAKYFIVSVLLYGATTAASFFFIFVKGGLSAQ